METIRLVFRRAMFTLKVAMSVMITVVVFICLLALYQRLINNFSAEDCLITMVLTVLLTLVSYVLIHSMFNKK